jgi:CRP-like cAMP-binding protein
MNDIHYKIIETLRNTAQLNDAQIEKCLSYFEKKDFRKKQHFLMTGEICNTKGLINKGCFRRYTTDASGKECVLNFAVEDWWIGDLESFNNQQPTEYSVQALEDSEVLCISRMNHLLLSEAIPAYKLFHDEKTRRSHYATLKRLTTAQSGSPEQKYLLLMEQQPYLFQRVPLHFIASYLGIEPESLSRLRKRITLKEKNLNHRQENE